MGNIITVSLFFLILGAGCSSSSGGDAVLRLEPAEQEWAYPYYLVIGGGLSETLSLLTINGPEDFALSNDVQLTASAINHTSIYQNELYAVCSLSHSVVVYDIQNLSISREISMGIGNNPMTLDFYQEHKAYISNLATNTVTFYDLSPDADENNRLLATIPLPSGGDSPETNSEQQTWSRPGTLTVVGDKVYCPLANLNSSFVAGGPGLLAVIDATRNKLEKTIPLEGRNTSSVYSHNDEILFLLSAGDYVPGTGFLGNGVIEIFDPSNDTVIDSIEIGGAPYEMAASPDGIAYVGNGKEGIILSFDMESLEVLDPVDIRDSLNTFGVSFVSALAVDGNGMLYAAEFNNDHLFIIDTNDGNRIIRVLDVNDGPDTLTFIR